jgi:hypothetical protein
MPLPLWPWALAFLVMFFFISGYLGLDIDVEVDSGSIDNSGLLCQLCRFSSNLYVSIFYQTGPKTLTKR